MHKIFFFLFLVLSLNTFSQPTDSTVKKNLLDSSRIVNYTKSHESGLQTYELRFNDSILVLSKHVKPSKVTVFIVTGEYCTPCHKLISRLKLEYNDSNKITSRVILYLINIPDEKKENSIYNSLGYQCFKNIDELSSLLPTTIIFSPTENEFEKIVGLEPKKIISTINMLSEYCK